MPRKKGKDKRRNDAVATNLEPRVLSRRSTSRLMPLIFAMWPCFANS